MMTAEQINEARLALYRAGMPDAAEMLLVEYCRRVLRDHADSLRPAEVRASGRASGQ